MHFSLRAFAVLRSESNRVSFMTNLDKTYDLIVVGSGFFGLTVAERAATQLGKRVLVIERRNHLCGDVFSDRMPVTCYVVLKFGAFLFPCSSKRVWVCVTLLTDFTGYHPRVFFFHSGTASPFPFGLGTFNLSFGNYNSRDEARDY